MLAALDIPIGERWGGYWGDGECSVMDGLRKRDSPARWPGFRAEMGGGMGAGRPRPPRMSTVTRPRPCAPALRRGRRALGLVTREEVRQRLGLAGRPVGDGRDLDETQRLRQPAGAGKQPFGLLGHVGLLEVVDELCRRSPLASRTASRIAPWGPGRDILDGRRPAGRDHVEADGARELVPMRGASGRRFQASFTALTETGRSERTAPLRSLSNAISVSHRAARRLGQLLDPLRVPAIDRLGGRGLGEPGRLSDKARVFGR